MEYRQLGGSGLTVSRIGFGGAVLGIRNYTRTFDATTPGDERTALFLISEAIDRGITLFDTAQGYGAGLSEDLIGRVVGNRDDLVVSSKIPGWKDASNPREDVETALRRLRRERIDLMQVHGLSFTTKQSDRLLEQGGLVECLERLRDEGKIGHIGFTSEDTNPSCYNLIESGRFETAQLSFSLMQTDAYNAYRKTGTMVAAAERGMGILTMRTLTSGSAQRFMTAIGVDPGPDFPRHLLRFVLANPLVDCALVGMMTREEIVSNVAVFDMPPLDLNALVNPHVP